MDRTRKGRRQRNEGSEYEGECKIPKFDITIVPRSSYSIMVPILQYCGEECAITMTQTLEAVEYDISFGITLLMGDELKH